jgi:hypothetical protein
VQCGATCLKRSYAFVVCNNVDKKFAEFKICIEHAGGFMKKFSLLSVLLLVAASTAILEAQSRFKNATDSLDYWHNRRFLIDGIKAYTQAELDSMTAAALRQESIKGVDLQEGPVFPDSTDGPQSYQTLFKNIRAGDETTAEPMVAVSPVNRNNFIAVYMRKVTGEWRPAASYTLNGGDSWTASDIPSGWYFYLRQADPVIDFDASGNAWYAWLDHDDLSSSYRNAILVGQSLSNTTLTYALPEGSFVSMKVFNTLGEEISELVNAWQEANWYEIRWNAGTAPSGVYYLRMSVTDAYGKAKYQELRKLLLVK